jgi:hypothetical protein
MTYDLPQQKGKSRAEVPEGAEVLLETALPHLSAAQRRALMVKTALPAGYPLSGRDRRPAVLAAGESAGGLSDGAESTLIQPRFVG